MIKKILGLIILHVALINHITLRASAFSVISALEKIWVMISLAGDGHVLCLIYFIKIFNDLLQIAVILFRQSFESRR